MSAMRQTVTSVTSSSATNNHESNLDALLDDLQSSISRSGSNVNMNGNVSGYREIRRTVTDGTHGGTTTQYHIEYLHPANSTTHISETSHHNNQLNSIDYGGQNVNTYKDVNYKYNTTNSDVGSRDVRLQHNISELDSLLDDLHTSQQSSFSDNTSLVAHRGTPGVDPGLLEPITSTPHVSRTVERHYREEKRNRGRSSSPTSAKRELVFTGGRSLDPSPVRHQAYYDEQRGPTRQQVYRYEKTTTTRTTGPTIQDVPAIESGGPPVSPVRSYNYTVEEPQPLPITYRSPSPASHSQSYHYSSTSSSRDAVPQPPPPQTIERVEKVTKYSTSGRDYPRDGYPRDGYPKDNHPRDGYPKDNHPRDGYPKDNHPRDGYPKDSYPRDGYPKDSYPRDGYPKDGYPKDSYPRDGYPDRRDPSPQRGYPGSKTIHSYSYSSNRETRESRPEVPKTPPPHRSPSPVSFPQPPLPNTKTTVKTYYDQSPRPHSPQSGPKFSPSDPSRTLTYNVSPPQHTVTTYKYSTTTSSNRYPEEVPLLPRPFPNPSPSPTPDQQPPKKLDELMASFSDTDVQQYNVHESSNRRYDPHPDPGPRDGRTPVQEKHIQSSKVVEKKEESKNVAGPPVYYPPGELFTKKEESMMQRQAGGGKYKEKAKYEYEASSKSKSKESSGKAVVPVCIPLCCGMPCVIM